MTNDIDNIIKQLIVYDGSIENKHKEYYDKGYKEGFRIGIHKNIDISICHNDDFGEIDMNSIKIFAKWCYINGIDFSYMAKGTDTVSFEDRVMNKFKKDLKSEQRDE